MRLGTETGSVVNHLYSRMTNGQPKPEVGMGVTLLSWTDRYPGTIQKVEEYCHKVWLYQIEVTEDEAVRTDSNGMSESQSYEYTPQPDGVRTLFRFNKKTGEWVSGRINQETGRFNIARGYGLIIGRREKYHDFSF